MRTTFYAIRALTNLHAGAGDANFGIIDKHVQRDSLTDLPAIFASSIKGSLRQLLTTRLAGDQVTEVFGSDNKGGDEAGVNQLKQGQYVFYQANLLALPIRSSHDLYYMATTPYLIQDLLDDLKRRGQHDLAAPGLATLAGMAQQVYEGAPKHFGPSDATIQMEGMTARHAGKSLDIDEQLKKLLGERIVLLHVNDFAQLAEELPTIARNSLNNGISVNLWYEEIVPRESRFYCPVLDTAPKGDGELLTTALADVDNLVQIGGNATVGNGLCEWTKIAKQ